jgi:hypothetical protein
MSMPPGAPWRRGLDEDEEHADQIAAQQEHLASLMIDWHQQAHIDGHAQPGSGSSAPEETVHDLRAKSTDLRRGPPATRPPSQTEFASLCGPILMCGPMLLDESTRLQSKGNKVTGQGILGRIVSLGDQLGVLLSELYLPHADTEALVAHLASTAIGKTRMRLALEHDASFHAAESWPVQLSAQLRQSWANDVAELSTYAAMLAMEADSRLKGAAISQQATPPPAWITGTRSFRDRLVRLLLARVHSPVATSPLDVRCAAAERLVTRADVEQLKRRGFCVLSDALAAAGVDASQLHSECASLHKAGVIDPANATDCNPGSCGAFLRCGSCEDLARLSRLGCGALQRAVRLLLGLAHAVQRRGYTQPGLAIPPQVLVSAYPPGAYYKTHADSYGRSHNARQLTCLLYANPKWDDVADGGCLRLEAHEPEEQVDVLPLAGTIVLFDAQSVYHSVQQSHRMRFAVTLWLWEAHAETQVD